MKNYKFLVPLALVVIFILSVYMVYDAEATKQEKYETAIATARDASSKEIWVDAEAAYMQALEVMPSVELYHEIGQFYYHSGALHTAMQWGGSMVEKYPMAPLSYEYVIAVLASSENFIECFKYADQMHKRGVQSEAVEAVMSRIEYTYFFNGSYTDVGVFCGGYCPVKKGDKWGYIDLTGKMKISAEFQKAGLFVGGLAPIVNQENEAYFIDAEGNKKMVVSDVENIEELGLIADGVFALSDGKTWSFYNEESEFLFGPYEEVAAIGNGWGAAKSNGKWIIVDKTGNTLNSEKYDAVAIDAKGLVYANDRIFVSYGNEYRMLDGQGTMIFTEGIDDVKPFNDATYAAVEIDGNWGFIDNNGAIVIDCEYEDARSFSNGLAAVKSGEMWGFIDLNGNMVIEPQFEDAKDFSSGGSVFVKTSSEEWSLLRLCKYCE